MLILFILSALAALYLSLSLIPMLSILFKIIGMKTENKHQQEFKNTALRRASFFIFCVICALATVIIASDYFYNNI